MQANRKLQVHFSLSHAPLGFFSGSTGGLSMFSLTVLFCEIRVLRRHTASTPRTA